MKKWLNIIGISLLLLTASTVHAQKHSGTVTGSVADSRSGEQMFYVSLALRQASDSSIVNGGISGEDGKFSITNIAVGKYFLQLKFIGYDDHWVDGISITKSNPIVALPTLTLSPQTALLDAVEISADRAVVTYEIDKKVVNVEDMNTTAAGSAIDVLENIPSINLDADGNVSLRGSSGFTLLIDGRPTNMSASDALQIIPATNIQDIEIITNPSAAYDAEGTSGIINVILKKDKLEGVSTLINANGGNFANYGADFLTSINKGKFKVNVGGNFKNVNRYRTIYQERKTTLDEGESVVISDGNHRFYRTNYGINTAFEYAANDNDVFSLSINGDQRQYNAAANYDFTESLNDTLVSAYENRERTLRKFHVLMASGGFKHQFGTDNKHFLNLTSMLNSNQGDEDAKTEYFDADDHFIGGNQAFEIGPSRLLRFSADYQRPLENDFNLQLGARADLANNGDDQDSYQYSSDAGQYEYLPDFSTDVSYLQTVLAGYGIISGKYKGLGYQGGLRGEHTDRAVAITTGNLGTSIQRMNWFPSAHFSYQSNDTNQFKLSISRRINRPRSWYLEPFITWEDPYTVRQGNPDLLPEYIMSYEAGWIHTLEKGSLSAEVYCRNTTNVIERIQQVYNDTNAIIKRPVNAGTSQALGLELSYQQRLTSWWKINAGANLFYYRIDGSVASGNLNNEQFMYNARLSQDFEIKSTWKVQFITKYVSDVVTAQGGAADYFNADIAVKKDWLDRKLTTTLTYSNAFKTMVNETWVETSTLYSYRLATPAWPVLSMAVSLRLNNYDHKNKIKTVENDSF